MAKKREPHLLPDRKSRPAWPEALTPDASLEDLVEFKEKMRAHPDTEAAKRLDHHLQAAHFDPIVQTSPELLRLVWLVREMLADFQPGERLEDMLSQVQTLMSEASGSRGGRPTNATKVAEWAECYARLKRTHRTLTTAQERWEEVASQYSERDKSPLKWRTVRDAVNSSRKSMK